MKVLLVSTSAILTPPEAYGGMERMVNWLAIGLNDMGCDVDVLCKTGSAVPNAIYGDSEQDFVEAIRDNIDGYDIIIDFSHDKLVCQTWPDKPQINTYQVMTVGWKKNPVFISRGQRKHCGYGDDAPVIYYGLDMDEYPLYEGQRCNYLLYLGSLITEKRPYWVAELSQITGIPAIIAGPRWQPEYWSTLDIMSEMDRVEVMDEVGGSEKIELIQKATCLIHPVGDRNWVEAGAIIVMESLACGTPVIATPNGCLPEYIYPNINGFLASNVEEMASKLPDAIKLPPDQCRASVEERFNYQRMAQDYFYLAEDVVDGKEW